MIGDILKIKIMSILNNKYEYRLTCCKNPKVTNWTTESIDNKTELDKQYLRKEKFKKLYDTSAMAK